MCSLCREGLLFKDRSDYKLHVRCHILQDGESLWERAEMRQFLGQRHWEDYLLHSHWNDAKQPSDITRITEIILHLLHQLQDWSCSALSCRDSTYILQLKFWFIPWLFHASTTAVMFEPSYFYFNPQTIRLFTASLLALFPLEYPCCSHTFSPIVILLYAFSYIQNQDWKFSVLLQSLKNLKATADSNLLGILQSICWASITAATQILYLSFEYLKYRCFTFLYLENVKYFVLFPILTPRNQLNWQLLTAIQRTSSFMTQCTGCCHSRGFLQMTLCSQRKKNATRSTAYLKKWEVPPPQQKQLSVLPHFSRDSQSCDCSSTKQKHFDVTSEQLYLKLWRFHLASVVVTSYFCAVVGENLHERMKVEGMSGSLCLLYLGFSKLFIRQWPIYSKTVKKKIQRIQKSEIFFNVFKSWKTISFQKEPCQKKKTGNFTITVSNV